MSDTLRQLQEEVARSRRAFLDASNTYDALVDKIPQGRNYPEENSRLAQAGEEFRLALHAYSQAVNRLHHFVTTRKLPDG